MTTSTQTTVPESAFNGTKATEKSEMVYFARMLSKIRAYEAGTLREDFHDNLGIFADAWCSDFLLVPYEDIKKRTLEGGTNEEILEWCFEKGRRLTDNDLMIFNGFISKLGWNDFVSETLQKRKEEIGLGDRDDIQTMPELFEYDEGRKS